MNDTYLSAVFEQHDDWWIGWVEELPGANAQEHTLDEARASLREVIPVILAERRAAQPTEGDGASLVREELTVAL